MILAYQLYGSRSEPLERTLPTLREAGWRHVEGYGGLYDDPEGLRAALDAHGLTMPSGHFALGQVEGRAEEALRTARVLGMEKVFVPWIEPEARGADIEGWRALAGRVAAALEPLRAEGLAVGWHNHDWDLADLGGGVTPLDLMAEAGLGIELDLGWVARAGQDPAAWIDRLGGRILAVHVKDLAPEGVEAEDGWADVGHGTTDWAPVRAALRRHGIDHLVAEHDNPADPGRFARRSLDTLKSW